MLDSLGMTTAAIHWKQILDDPEFGNFTAQQILYHLLKSRADLHYPTVFNTQYEPSEWSKWLSDDPGCFGKLDGIRRRLTTGFTVEIVKL